MKLYINKPGLWTTVQDSGRRGFQQFGMPVSGAMDAFALRVANLLVGNPGDAAALEMTMTGPALTFEGDTLIALCGGDLAPSINGEAVPGWRPVLVRGGSELRFGSAARGCRAYLAAAGGLDVPRVLGSRSTYVRAELGGIGGRALQSGDELPLGEPSAAAAALARALARGAAAAHAGAGGAHSGGTQAAGGARSAGGSRSGGAAFAAPRWFADAEALAGYRREPVIRFVRGREYGRFTEESRRQLASGRFVLSPRSDRMGFRLDGPVLALEQPADMVSSPVTEGTVQVPPDGAPIILMADRQTTGGYPRIAQIAAVDLPLLAQTLPGSPVAFREISREEAEKLYLRREKEFRSLESSLRLYIDERME